MMKIRFVLFLLALFLALPATAAEFTGSYKQLPSGASQMFEFGSNRAVNDFTMPIQSCGSMRVTWDRSTGAVASLYATRPTDDTLAEIEAATLVVQFTVDQTIVVPQDSTQFRIVVDTSETSTTIPSYALVFCSASAGSGSGGVIGSGLYEDMILSVPAAGDQWLLTDDNNVGSVCDVGGTPATADLWCGWNGTSWVGIGIAGGGIAEVAADGSPTLGGPLEANGNSITQVLDLQTKKLDSRTWFASQYASGSDTGGIVQALAACDAANGGRVILPAGVTTIDATAIASPIINLPADNWGHRGHCSLEGAGSMNATEYNVYGGSTLIINNSADKTAIRVNGSSQVLRGFDMVLPGITANGIGIQIESEAFDAYLTGEHGVANFLLDHVSVIGIDTSLGDLTDTLGTGVLMRFGLKSQIIGGTIKNFDAGIKLTKVLTIASPESNQSNANLLSGVQIRANDVGLLLADQGSCQNITLSGATIEANTIGLSILGTDTTASACLVRDIGTHWENETDNINIVSNHASYIGIAPQMSSAAVGHDIVRSDNNWFGTPDVVIGGDLAGGVNYTGGAEIRLLNSANISVWNGALATTATGEVGYSANCPAWGAAGVHVAGDLCFQSDDTLFVCEPTPATDGICKTEGEWTQFNHGFPISEGGTNYVDSPDGVELYGGRGIVPVFTNGDPDTISFDFDFSKDYASASMGVEQLEFTTTGTGAGGWIGEGATNNPTEFKYSISLAPDTGGADTEYFFPLAPFSLMIAGPTQARTVTFPDANFTAARTDASNTFTGAQINTAEMFADALGVEFETGDALNDCSTFANPGGGIFYDTSEGKLMKCQNNALTALDTGGSGAPGGAIGTVQYHDTGDVLGGDAGMVYDAALDKLTLLGSVVAPTITTTPSDTAEVRLTSATDAQEVAVRLSDNGTTSSMEMVVDDGTGIDQQYMLLNGANAIITTTKPLDVSGFLTGTSYNLTTSGTTHSPSGRSIRGAVHWYTSGSTKTVTLPKIATAGDGVNACFYNMNGAGNLIIDADADDWIRLSGVAGTAGSTIDASTPTTGDFVCMIGRDNGADDEWIVLGKAGDWAAN